MKEAMGENKDWLDALREMDFSEGASPSPASWEAVGRRVRRAAALRRAGLTAAALVPVAALLLWAPWHRPAQPAPAGPVVAQVAPAPDTTVAPAPAPAPVIPEVTPVVPVLSKAVVPAPSRPLPPSPEEVASVPEDEPVVIEEVKPENDPQVEPARPADDMRLAQADPVEPFDESVFREDPRRHRARVSVGVRGGADMASRQTDVSMQSRPNLLAMNYVNTFDPSLRDYVKSNSGGDMYSFLVSNGFGPTISSNIPSDTRFRHDLPVSLGLSVRLDLTPRVGLESGLEYTYLHSVEEFAGDLLDQRLHFVGIPLRADVRLWDASGFSLYAGLGGKVEKCVYATLGQVESDEKKLQWSAGLFAGAQYRIAPRVQLYFQPELSYYFTDTELVTCRSEHPLNVSLQAGLRFEL